MNWGQLTTITVLSSVMMLFSLYIDNIFIGMNKTHIFLIKKILYNLGRCSGIFFLILFFDMYGILLAWSLSDFISSLIFFFPYLLKFRPKFDSTFLKGVAPFNLANYLLNTVNLLPTIIFPFLIGIFASATEVGYFTPAWSLASILYSLIYTASLTLISEKKKYQQNHKQLQHIIIIITLLLITLTLGISILYSNSILSLFGDEYPNNSRLTLILLIIGAYAVLFRQLLATQYQKRADSYSLGIFSVILVITISMLAIMFLMVIPKSISVAFAWFIGNSTIVLISFIKNSVRLFKSKT